MSDGYEAATQNEGRHQANDVDSDYESNQTGARNHRAGQVGDGGFEDGIEQVEDKFEDQNGNANGSITKTPAPRVPFEMKDDAGATDWSRTVEAGGPSR